ncbi:MAG: D-2-hydroxyacid dehydrogenase [Kiloniellales bacterium]|nr:D-2-hydroxyacid dehydrogenase [Kiloniellales bacterium]
MSTSQPGTPKVLVLFSDTRDIREVLEPRFPDLPVTYASSTEAIGETLERVRPEVVFSIKDSGFAGDVHKAAIAFPSVRWFHVGGSGYEHVIPWDAERVTVTNGAGVLARFLAETATGAMLMLNGNLLSYRDQQRAVTWRPIPFRPLSDQTLLVVGVGAIGGYLADNAKALGMRVLGTRRSGAPHPSVEEMHPPEALPDLLGRADVVSLHLRLTEETRHTIDRAALAAMKPGAMLINTARGPVVDEPALIAALESGHLGAAYLDVFETEPLPPDSPLWSFDRVFVTPHASDNVTRWPGLFAERFADNLERWIRGEPLQSRVSP